MDKKTSFIKPFSPFDILIYILILAFIALLFLYSVFLNNNIASGFQIFIDNEKILSYEYNDSNPTYYNNSNEYIEFDKQNSQITVFFDSEHLEYNIISFDNQLKTVIMKNSTCSNTKDCVYLPAISNTGMIYCAPHHLKVLPLINEKSNPVVG